MDIIEIGSNSITQYLTSETGGTTYENMAVENANKTVKLDLPDDRAVIEEFMKALSLAHECRIEHGCCYSGLSPDDIELVNFCKEQKFQFVKAKESNYRKLEIDGKGVSYEVLKVIEFSSDRKRMSIVVIDGEHIKMYIKGADSEIENRLSAKGNNPNFIDQAKNYIKYFSSMGYRTLMVGMKVISQEEFTEYIESVRKAGMLSPEEKKKALIKIDDKFERDLFLLGATIVEDKLQDYVPETIRDLRLAGIKIWMLTGDKLTTARNIGNKYHLTNDLIIFLRP